MKKLSQKEMKKISGGAFTAAFLTALVRGVNSFLDVGRSLGSAVRRISAGKMCPL